MKQLGMGQYPFTFHCQLQWMVSQDTAVTWAIPTGFVSRWILYWIYHIADTLNSFHLSDRRFLLVKDLFVHEITILSIQNPHFGWLNQHSCSFFMVKHPIMTIPSYFMSFSRYSSCFPWWNSLVGWAVQAPACLVAAGWAPRCQRWSCTAGGQVAGDLRAAGGAPALMERSERISMDVYGNFHGIW